MNDGPFDSEFFREEEEKHRERLKENSAIHRWLGFGLLATLAILAVYLAVYGALVAVVLWVGFTIAQHFGVLALGLGLIA